MPDSTYDENVMQDNFQAVDTVSMPSEEHWLHDQTHPVSPVIVRKITKLRGKQLSEKRLACLYCGQLYRHRISEHLAKRHDGEKEVARALAQKGEPRRLALEVIKNKGNYKYNVKVLSSGTGEIIVGRRSETNRDADEYLPCIHCLGFFKAKLLWKHHRSCKDKEIDPANSVTKIQMEARVLLNSSLLLEISANDKKLEPVLSSMKRDDVYEAVIRDTLIKNFGIVLLDKLGTRRNHDISQRMRQVARLLLTISSSDLELSEVISGKSFDLVIEGVFSLTGKRENEERITVFEKPGLALRLGHNLVKCAQIKRGFSLRHDDDIGYKEANRFLELHSSEWADKVSSVALATLKTNKFNKPTLLPVTSDLVKLKNYIDKTIDTLTTQLEEEVHYPIWRQLAEVTLAKVLVFNKRRSAEGSHLLRTTYTNRGNWKEHANQEIFASLSAVEKRLFSRLDVVQTQGKQNKTVNTLLTEEMVAAIDLLIKTRGQCGISDSNPFIFSSGGDGPLSAWQVASTAGCEHPELISSTRLRKYMATVVQVINLNGGELHWLASHLGHDLSTHKNYYRQHEAILEVTKISRLLMAAEAGKLGDYSGKKLEDIRPEDIVMPNDGDAADDETDVDVNNIHVDSIDSILNDNDDGNKVASSNDINRSKTKRVIDEVESDHEEWEPETYKSRKNRKLKTTANDDKTDESLESSRDGLTKVFKKRWTDEENTLLKKFFNRNLEKGLMPAGSAIQKAIKSGLANRTVAQIRTKLNNLIHNKQKKLK